MLRSLAFGALLAGCAGGPPHAPEPADDDAIIAYDSAGVLVVENRADTAALPRLVPGEVRLRLGVVEGPQHLQFTSVVGAALLDDGTLVIADNEAMQIRWFGPDGTHLRSAGRRGDGPGEFRQIFSLARLGPDSVVVWDTFRDRATVFDGAGRPVRTTRLHGPSPQGTAGDPHARHALRPAHAAGDGWLSVAHAEIMPPLHIGAPLVRRVPVLVLRHDGSGQVTDTLATGAHEELLVPAERVLPNQYGNARFMTPHGARRTYTALEDARVHVASTDGFRIETYADDGRLLRVLTYPRLEIEYTAAEFDARRARALDGAATGERARDVAQMMDPRFRPERRPTMSALRVDAAGRLWVLEWGGAADAPVRWLVLGTDGIAEAVAEIPREFQLLHATAEAAVVATRDELGVPYVLVMGWRTVGAG